MAKIITTIGACSVRKKPIGLQFVVEGGESSLGGSYAIAGDKAVVSGESPAGKVVIGPNFARLGCKYCGNKAVFLCGDCGRYVCYDGKAQRNFTCPSCGAVANVPAVSGGVIPKSDARGSGPVGGSGGTVRLRQGQEVKIEFSDGRRGGGKLTKLEVGLGWDPLNTDGSTDLDSSVVVAGRSEFELVYFGDKEHESGCVVHHGDNLTGEDEDRHGTEDDENISVFLDSVPSDRDRLIFILNIYSPAARQKLSSFENVYIRIYDPETRRPLIEYSVEQANLRWPSLIIGMAYRSGGGWCFKAIGKGSDNSNVHDLADEVFRHY